MHVPKILFKQPQLLVSLFGLALSSILIFQLILAVPIKSDPGTPTASNPASYKHTAVKVKQEKVEIGLPIRLSIPKISVDAIIEQVGLSIKGEMNTPKDPNNAAWYKFGPRPGENGSSVIDGHFGSVLGKPAVFDNLHILRAGDNLYIQDDNEVTTAFVVRELQTYYHDDNAVNVFVSTDGKAHLNLITCAGTWDKATRNYSNRIVVFADKE